MNNIYKEYQEAYEQFFIAKKWLKCSPDRKQLLADEYTNKGLVIPCDGNVQTPEDAAKAVGYYKAFFSKLVHENATNTEIDDCFKRTIKKYGKMTK